ncbi:hypothetical protein J1605_006440 [Eschrichtius robustus]|uniref:Secreted protein n=1 Tax=Eschrichtius robustus TaxID=9764 RepID=A0AB34H5P1_ESCRO|nr:hypothetical protein J1605_006440 [Eschrichtius robustus]
MVAVRTEVVVMAMMLVKALVTRGIMGATITVTLVEVLEVMSEDLQGNFQRNAPSQWTGAHRVPCILTLNPHPGNTRCGWATWSLEAHI